MSKALPSKGFSASWSTQQKNVVRIFNLMAAVDEELSQLDQAHDWHTFSEEILCSQPVYERFAYFVLYDYEADGKKADEYRTSRQTAIRSASMAARPRTTSAR